VLVRVDNRANLESLPASKESLIQPPGLKEYSVRWIGFLTPEESANYQLEATGFANKVWLDDKVVLDNSKANPDGSRITTVALEKGRRYALKLECAIQDDLGATLLWARLLDHPLSEAIAAAKNADVVIAVVGITSQLEGEELRVNQPGFKGGDRTSLDLPQEEEDLLRAMKKTGKPLVVVLMNGSALAVNWADQNVPAILEAWYPGQEGGTAVAGAIAGDFSPAGRLPITFYKSVEQLPAFEDYSMAKRTYRYFDGEPLYPFGYGLSFTSFTYKNPRVDHAKLNAGQAVTVSVEVANAGAMAGDEVVQLYLTHPGVDGAALRALKGFQRVHLDRGEKKTVSFSLSDRELSIVDAEGKRRVVRGDVQIWVGGGQPVARGGSGETAGVRTQLTITGEGMLPD
jgi:beta-glucosidase